MAFTYTISGSADSSSTTSRSVSFGFTANSGDLIIVAIGCRPATINLPSGWTNITYQSAGSQTNARSFYLKASGGETAVTVTTSSIACAWTVIRVTAGHADPASSPPEGANTYLDSNDANPDPPNLAPTGGSDAYLWIAWFFQRDRESVSAYPSGYTDNTGFSVDTTTYVKAGWATKEATASSDNPGTFTTTYAHDWSTITMAVYPAGSGTTVNLTGVSSTSGQGSLSTTGGALFSLTGVSSTGNIGTLTTTGGATITLSGQNATGQIGDLSIIGGTQIALSGTETTGQTGNLTTTGGSLIDLSGVEGTGQVGTLSIGLSGGASVSLTGVSSTGQTGDLTLAGGALVNLDGIEITGDIGALEAGSSVTISLTGVQATSQQGVFTLTTGAAISITGVSSTGQVGTLTASTAGTVNIETPTHRIYTIEQDDRTYLILQDKRIETIH